MLAANSGAESRQTLRGPGALLVQAEAGRQHVGRIWTPPSAAFAPPVPVDVLPPVPVVVLPPVPVVVLPPVPVPVAAAAGAGAAAAAGAGGAATAGAGADSTAGASGASAAISPRSRDEVLITTAGTATGENQHGGR